MKDVSKTFNVNISYGERRFVVFLGGRGCFTMNDKYKLGQFLNLLIGLSLLTLRKCTGRLGNFE